MVFRRQEYPNKNLCPFIIPIGMFRTSKDRNKPNFVVMAPNLFFFRKSTCGPLHVHRIFIVILVLLTSKDPEIPDLKARGQI